MTTSSAKPTTRLTTAYVREKGLRPLVVTIVGGLIELRPKGMRTREVGDLASIWQQCVKARVASEKAQKRASRKAKR